MSQDQSPARSPLQADSSPQGAATLAHKVGDVILERKGTDLVVLDVERVTSLCDYMVIATGRSNRHVRTIAEAVVATSKASGTIALGAEGLEEGWWVVLDLGDVIVHVMQEDARAHYEIESFWEDGEVVRRVAEVA